MVKMIAYSALPPQSTEALTCGQSFSKIDLSNLSQEHEGTKYCAGGSWVMPSESPADIGEITQYTIAKPICGWKILSKIRSTNRTAKAQVNE